MAASVTCAPAARTRPALRELARLVTGTFLAVPLIGVVLGVGRPSLMLTLSGLAALHLAAELFADRVGRSIPEDRSLQIVLVTWVASLAVLGAAGWTGSVPDYHGQLVVLVGVLAGCFIGLVSPRIIAVLWGVAATSAVAMGASLAGPLTAEVGVAAAAVGAGTLGGAIVGEILERSLVRWGRAVSFEP